MEYGAAYYHAELEMPDAAYALVSKARAAKMQPHIDCSDRVLEYGVGSGLNLAAVNCGFRHGCDVNPTSNDIARTHGITVVDQAQCVSESYDVVICHHVLEHVTAPAQCLVDIHRVLRPGGKLLLFVPYEEQRRYRKPIPGDTAQHLYSWNPHTLANLVTDCGFEVLSARLGTFGYDRIAARMAARLRLGDAGFRTLWACAHLLRREREVRIVAVRS